MTNADKIHYLVLLRLSSLYPKNLNVQLNTDSDLLERRQQLQNLESTLSGLQRSPFYLELLSPASKRKPSLPKATNLFRYDDHYKHAYALYQTFMKRHQQGEQDQNINQERQNKRDNFLIIVVY